MSEAWHRYRAFLRRQPEVTVHWTDRETGARGWLVINSLRGGAAGGGTRMRQGLRPREVVYLAKAMELKFALAGPSIGGAKTGLDFDPGDPRKADVLERWYRAISPYLRHHYGTGGDLNVDEVLDVIPCFERLGLRHPQEGVVRGHFGADEERAERILRALDAGVKAPLPPVLGVAGHPVTVADMATGYGVASSVRRYCERRGRPLEGARVLLEGFGNVGAAAGLYLARAGARIVAIRDAEKTLVDPDGLDAAQVEALICRRVDKLLPCDDSRLVRDDAEAAFWAQRGDVFVCAALSGAIAEATLERMAASGVRVIASGANHPFREARLGSTRVARMADRRFAVIADVLANCGMARAFSYLMEPDSRPSAADIFPAIDRTIHDALDEVLDRAGGGRNGTARGLLAATLALALDRTGAA